MHTSKNDDTVFRPWINYVPPFARAYIPNDCSSESNATASPGTSTHSSSPGYNQGWMQFVPPFAHQFIPPSAQQAGGGGGGEASGSGTCPYQQPSPQQQQQAQFGKEFSEFVPPFFGGGRNVFGPHSVRDLTESVHVFGPLWVSGDIRGGIDVSVQGPITVAGSVEAGDLHFQGVMHMAGRLLHARNMTWAGYFHHTTGKTLIDGMFNGTGRLEALVIEAKQIKYTLDSHNSSSVRGMFGESINVRARSNADGERLLVDCIVAKQDVSIERTSARVVVGDRVRVGSGCNVEEVIYESFYEKAPDAVVKRATKKIFEAKL